MTATCNECGCMNNATMDDDKFCLGCGSKLPSNTHDQFPANQEVTDQMANELALRIAATMNGQDEIHTDSNSSPAASQSPINDINHQYQIHKYLYIKFADPSYSDICGKIINVIHVERGENLQYKHVQLEDESEFKFYDERNNKYQFIQILDEPHWNKSKLNLFSNWDLMSLRQRLLILFMMIIMIIVDCLYIIGWTVDELTKLHSNSITNSGETITIYCGKDSVYDRNNDNLNNKILYRDICDWNGDECDMKIYGEIVMDGVIMSLLLNCLIWVSMLITIFYDRSFMKNICNRITLFVGFVVGGVLTGIAMILWSNIDGSRCKNACEYIASSVSDNDIECEWEYGVSYILYFSVSLICLMFGVSLSFLVRYV